MYRAFYGANGAYVAWEQDDGFHHAPPQYERPEFGQDFEAAKREAARRNQCVASNINPFTGEEDQS
jgi:hypothetical protein